MQEASTPAKPSDSVKVLSHVSPDAPECETSENAMARRQAFGQENKTSGMRTRLLMEAAERALHSETPWSDLSLVASLIGSLATRKKFQEAHRLTATLSDPKARTTALQSLAESEARYLDLDSAILSLKCLSNSDDWNRALVRITAIRTSLGDHDGALQTVHRIIDPALRKAAVLGVNQRRILGGSVSKESLVMSQLREGNLDAAFRRVQGIRIDDRRYRALPAIAVAMMQAEGVKVARNVVNMNSDPVLKEATYGKVAQRVRAIRKEPLTPLHSSPILPSGREFTLKLP